MSEWRDITTAPLDGTPVDLWDRRGFRWTGKRWGIHDWLNGKPVGKLCWGPHEGDQWNNAPEIDPTHWQPLPEPPEG